MFQHTSDVYGTSIPDDLRDTRVSPRALRIVDAPWLFEGYNDTSVATQTANEETALMQRWA